ncbi:MAG: DHA2 family efflux MFS transporter permease subunit, partial [Actinomycetia bacterium]|nr:DHA2 family efflux MFS transporter permease subunit [Actinomycetes bacterium]
MRTIIFPLVAPAAPRARRSPAPLVVLLVASFGAFLAFLDSTIVNIAFPDIAASFPEVDISGLSWVLTSYNIVFAAFLVVAGRIAALLGRRRVFVIGVIVFTIASALCAAADSVAALVAWRVLQGVGAALLVPASLGLVVQGYPAARRAHGVELWGAAAAIAAGLGPPIGGALVEASSWRLAFLVNVPLGIAAVVLSRSLLVESRAAGARRTPDLPGALLLAVALGLLTLGLVQGPEWGFADLRVLGSLAGAAAAAVGFVLRSRTHPAPVVDRSLLAIPSFSAGTALTVVAGAGFYAYLLAHILFLTSVWRYSLIEAGLAVTPAALVATVVAAVLGRVADRFGHRVVVVPGALIWAAGLFWYHQQVGPTPDFFGEWLPGQILQGIGVGATLPVLGGAALAGVSGSYATASAVVSSARQFGAVLGVSGMVILLDLPGNPDALRDGWLLAAVCFATVAIGTLLVDRDRPAPEPEPVAPTPAPPRPREDPGAAGGMHLFGTLDDTVAAKLRARAWPVAVAGGEVLFREGDPADALYVVDTGRLQ